MSIREYLYKQRVSCLKDLICFFYKSLIIFLALKDCYQENILIYFIWMIIVLFKMVNGTLTSIFKMNWTIDYLIGSTHIKKICKTQKLLNIMLSSFIYYIMSFGQLNKRLLRIKYVDFDTAAKYPCCTDCQSYYSEPSVLQ